MDDEILIRVQTTPNPNAWKFIVNRPVLVEGKITFKSPEEAESHILARDLFSLEDVQQVHFFQNVITITQEEGGDFDTLQPQIISILKTRMPVHNPHFSIENDQKKERKDLGPEVMEIESILDRTIRPALQGDGGDIEVISYKDKKVFISYQGACGTCPSATAGTLMAIEGILRDEYDPEIEVIPIEY